MILYETQTQNDLFFTLIPLNSVTAPVWNAYYGGNYHSPPMLSEARMGALQAQIQSEYKETPPRTRTARLSRLLRDGMTGYLPWPRPDADAYVAVASNTRLNPAWMHLTPHSPELSMMFDCIEMTVGVYDAQKEPYTCHMGITRTPASLLNGRPSHAHLAPQLHAFAAMAMLELHRATRPPKSHMINVPTWPMLYLLTRALNAKGLGHAITCELAPSPPSADAMAEYQPHAELLAEKGLGQMDADWIDLNLRQACYHELWREPGVREPMPTTAFGKDGLVLTNGWFAPNPRIAVQLPALAALADFPHPITRTQIA